MRRAWSGEALTSSFRRQTSTYKWVIFRLNTILVILRLLVVIAWLTFSVDFVHLSDPFSFASVDINFNNVWQTYHLSALSNSFGVVAIGSVASPPATLKSVCSADPNIYIAVLNGFIGLKTSSFTRLKCRTSSAAPRGSCSVYQANGGFFFSGLVIFARDHLSTVEGKFLIRLRKLRLPNPVSILAFNYSLRTCFSPISIFFIWYGYIAVPLSLPEFVFAKREKERNRNRLKESHVVTSQTRRYKKKRVQRILFYHISWANVQQGEFWPCGVQSRRHFQVVNLMI